MQTDDAFSFSCSPSPEAADNVAAPALTLADHAEGLCKRYESWQSSPHTIIRLRRALRLFIAYLDEHHNVGTPDAIALEHVHAFQAHLSQRFTEKGLPWKPISINTVIKAVAELAPSLATCRGTFSTSASRTCCRTAS